MQSERKQEIAKAKLKKVRQQLNTPADVNQVGGGTVPVAPAQANTLTSSANGCYTSTR